ncbi:sulfite reductase [Solemya pervernicosa gill symbiont]|uniref:Sulfite reductase n=2 Tax=Gammaproteobacteria incertae sedis TaxID=118884 RepID=A0A1T2L5R5_9GAMM|nr:TusE/DsrC/DsvC family sulfur relay protein [Candidatus Reidiella endopervernicosa]OOZ40429.1 sulfite reductase [Solemya pervernicosa gill symbiont]QKQ25341.1 TusE/DsrC/DsvC family sulfur relay protein [Candidatus Reidiella endopervernicosa]
MLQTMHDVLHPRNIDPDFPTAPVTWSRDEAVEVAGSEAISLSDEHWHAIRALQDYFSKHDGKVNVRALHDALDEEFHASGGLNYLYTIFPGGPIAQGCRLAGLKAPAGAADKSFGSVV